MTAVAVRATLSAEPMDDDADLYRRWAAGERHAGERLIERHLDTVGRFLANKCPDASRLEDLVATVFERCATGLGRFRGDSSFRTYLLGIAYNLLREEFKRVARAPVFDEQTLSVADVAVSPSAFAAARQEHHVLLLALRHLPFASQVVLELHFFEDLSRAQIAALLELPAGTVATRLRAARAKLAVEVQRLRDEPSAQQPTQSNLDDWVAGLRKRLGLHERSAPEA